MADDREKLKGFLRFLEGAGALGIGSMVAFIFSLKQVNPKVRFEVNIWTWVVLAVSVAVSWWAIRYVLALVENEGDSKDPRQVGRAKFLRMGILGVVLLGGTIASFYYSLGDLSSQKRFDVAVGTGMALLFVALAMFGFWRLVRFLERQGNPEADDEQRDREEEQD